MYSAFLTQTLATAELDKYYTFEGGFSREQVAMLEKQVSDSNIQMNEASTFSGAGDALRKSRVGWLPMNENFLWLHEKLGDMVNIANKELWRFDIAGMAESIQYAEYPADGGHYDWHMDTGPDQFSRRKISITVQLSDPSEYEGGDLQLKINSGHQNTPKGFGTVVIFPSYLLHRVTPVTGGLRKSLVLWITGPAFK
jgi:PKHD-type hydroxylase